MRIVSATERIKRGCEYCTDFKKNKNIGSRCKYNKCPYKELDGFKTYEDYYKSKPGLLTELLKGVKK